MFLNKLFILIFLFNILIILSQTPSPTYLIQTGTVTGQVQIDRSSNELCKPVDITITMTFNIPIQKRQSIYVDLPGFTNGPCTESKNGYDFHPKRFFYIYPVSLLYYEGTYDQMYTDSKLRIYFEDERQLTSSDTLTIVIDKSEGLKMHCLHQTSFPVTLREIRTDFYVTIGSLTFSSFIPKYCFFYNASLTFFPSKPQQHLELNLTLELAMNFKYGDNITIYLPQFTNSAQFNSSSLTSQRLWQRTPYTPSNITLVDLRSDSIKYHGIKWHGRYIEGSGFDSSLTFDSMYTGSRLQLWIENSIQENGDYTDKYIQAGDVFSIIIGRKNKLSTYCAVPSNYTSFKIALTSRNTSLTIPKTTIPHTSAIGKGCPLALNQSRQYEVCAGKGQCNLCTQQCECFDGFGSLSDRQSVEVDNFPRNCTGNICPFGISFGSLIQPSGSSSFQNAHSRTECSSAGICNREKGLCKCFPGFTGAACQRKICPGIPECSGRGRCYDMYMMSTLSEAFPLRSTATLERYYYPATVDSSTWDGQYSRGCICDSSWSVGLGFGETQLSEYFGPACELRRCPSGDDPTTPSVDETDCNGKNQINGVNISAGVGVVGNLCHYECSGQGTCDYNTGICSCFPGVEGPNCGRLISNARSIKNTSWIT